MIKKLKYISFFLLPFLASCEDKDVTEGDDISVTSADVVSSIVITRAGEEPKEDPDIYFKEGESCVLISQQYTSAGTTIDFSETSCNRYKYIYNGNKDADWDMGFNFTSEEPISWEKVLLNGQFGSGFAFGALFFPRDYKYSEEIDADQRDPEALYASDILGAWHKTSEINDRLRFRMWHLMCKMQVDLYIPVFDEETATGYDLDNVIASAINFRTSYNVGWPDRNTDIEPILTATDQTIQDIYLYQYPEVEEIEDLEMNDFQNHGTDHVRKYSFEMLFPYQTVDGDILRFTLQRGDISYNYVFNSNKHITDNSVLRFEQGKINQLELYLNRSDNEIVFIRAYIRDWNDARANLTLTEENPEGEQYLK